MQSRVFIIENKTELIDAYHEIFDILGFKMESACNGEEAISKFEKEQKCPDLVVLANHLPDMSGIEAMNEILRKDSSMKIIYVGEDEKTRKKALDHGAVDFIQKPFSLQEFVTALVENIKR